MEIPQEASKHQKSIIKKGNVFVCLLCNAEEKHGNHKSRHKKTLQEITKANNIYMQYKL